MKGPPTRWLEDPEGAPPGALELLRHAAPPPPLEAAAWARSAELVGRLATASSPFAAATRRATALACLLALAALGGLWLAAARGREEGSLAAAWVERPVAEASKSFAPAGSPRQEEGSAKSQAEAPDQQTLLAKAVVSSSPDGATGLVVKKALAPPAVEVVAKTPTPRSPAAEDVLALEGACREGQLLERARAALVAGAPRDTLAQLERHSREFPRGVLLVEREALEVLALEQLGRRDEARLREVDLERRAATPLLERLRLTLAHHLEQKASPR